MWIGAPTGPLEQLDREEDESCRVEKISNSNLGVRSTARYFLRASRWGRAWASGGKDGDNLRQGNGTNREHAERRERRCFSGNLGLYRYWEAMGGAKLAVLVPPRCTSTTHVCVLCRYLPLLCCAYDGGAINGLAYRLHGQSVGLAPEMAHHFPLTGPSSAVRGGTTAVAHWMYLDIKVLSASPVHLVYLPVNKIWAVQHFEVQGRITRRAHWHVIRRHGRALIRFQCKSTYLEGVSRGTL